VRCGFDAFRQRKKRAVYEEVKMHYREKIFELIDQQALETVRL
jgi:hypothetical protein